MTDCRPPGPAVAFRRPPRRERARRGESAHVEDLEATLDALERRIAALQADLGEPEHASPAEADPLAAFGERLRSTAAGLISAYDRALAEARGAPTDLFSEDVAVEARTDLAGLRALSSALEAVPGVHGVQLRAYAGGHAVLDVALDRPVALVAELRGVAGPPIAVLEARPGRLAIEVGAGASAARARHR